MDEITFTRFICWDKQPLSKVINTEALSIDKDLFLATHSPFNVLSYVKSPRQIKDTSEKKLLDELLQRGHNNEHTFIVMQGIPGTGKSHLIRWLKEQYAVENRESGGNDVVLLVERANSSLRQTLTQIISSGLFNAARFANQVAKLESATQQLSDESLSDTILNNLQVATREVDAPAPRRIQGKVEKFLLDFFVRQELKKEGAAIERIRLFLSGREASTGLGDKEIPRFEEKDFEFSIELLRQIRDEGGHRDAKALTETLHHKSEKRQELADYLNQLIPFAIERTTALSANDLKQLFFDLRRELKNQGKNLVLFIEDISVFTGLDAGLVDVLVTQHTGESGKEYCRLTSVVGITDAYFKGSFPDNIKQRVTHHLTLNFDGQREQSQLLTDPKAVTDMSARYLNALRLTKHELQEWVRVGAKSEELPNACLSCQHRIACHAAFGASPLGESDNEKLQIGLYPFNERVLWTLFEGLDTSKVSKTPRSLLGSILEYILQSHGPRISEGLFPPPVRELANDVHPPTLQKDTQRRLITEQSNSSTEADRIESLTVYWGDRTVDHVSRNGQTEVGSLTETVFLAFDLPFIEGDTSAIGAVVGPRLQDESGLSISRPPMVSKPPKQDPAPISVPPQVQVPDTDPIIVDIQEWRSGSELKHYDQLAKWLAEFVKEYVDWEAHGVSQTLVDDRVRQRRFVFEGQRGRASGDYLIFKRSDDLAFVLQGLAAFQKGADAITDEEMGGHLITLSNWITENEAQIVEYVSRPQKDLKPSRPLLDLLVETNLLIACLGEDLTASRTTTRELYFRIMTEHEKQNSWPALDRRIPNPRSGEWRDLMRGIQKYAVKDPQNSGKNCREELFILTNCRQGTSRQIQFINAASVLDIIARFKKSDWKIKNLSPNQIAKNASEPWVTAINTYNQLQRQFEAAIKAEQERVCEINSGLGLYLDGHTPQEVFTAIEELLESFRENAISVTTSQFSVDDTLTYRKLKNRLEDLNVVQGNKVTEDLALALSGSGELLQESLNYIEYFERFVRMVKQKEENLNSRIGSLEGEHIGGRKYQETLTMFETLEQLLESVVIDAEELVT